MDSKQTQDPPHSSIPSGMEKSHSVLIWEVYLSEKSVRNYLCLVFFKIASNFDSGEAG
jgi:hypothetical protein